MHLIFETTLMIQVVLLSLNGCQTQRCKPTPQVVLQKRMGPKINARYLSTQPDQQNRMHPNGVEIDHNDVLDNLVDNDGLPTVNVLSDQPRTLRHLDIPAPDRETQLKSVQFAVSAGYSKLLSDSISPDLYKTIDDKSVSTRLKRRRRDTSIENNAESNNAAKYQTSPWDCGGVPVQRDLGVNYYPRFLRELECQAGKTCYLQKGDCVARAFTIILLKKTQDKCVVINATDEETRDEFGIHFWPRVGPDALEMNDETETAHVELWKFQEISVTFCCECQYRIPMVSDVTTDTRQQLDD